jgi:hypothetical protein
MFISLTVLEIQSHGTKISLTLVRAWWWIASQWQECSTCKKEKSGDQAQSKNEHERAVCDLSLGSTS